MNQRLAVEVVAAFILTILYWAFVGAHHMSGIGVMFVILAVGVIFRSHETGSIETVRARLTRSDYAWLEGTR